MAQPAPPNSPKTSATAVGRIAVFPRVRGVCTFDPTLTRGHVQATIHGLDRSCTDLLASGSGSCTITWNTGETSAISYHRSANYVLGTLVIVESGTVTAGEFTGNSVAHVVELLNLDLLACLAEPGLTTASGIGTYVFA